LSQPVSVPAHATPVSLGAGWACTLLGHYEDALPRLQRSPARTRARPFSRLQTTWCSSWSPPGCLRA